jgi:hypothetical protein
VLAIGILARFYKCLEQPTSNDRDSNQNVSVPDNVTKVGALWKVNSSLAFPLHIWNRDLLWSPHQGCRQGCHSCSPMFSQPASRRVCVHDHLIASRNYSTMIRAISTKTFLTGGASTSGSQRSLRLNRSDSQCHSKRPRNQVLQVLETTSATCYSVGLLTIMRYNTSYGGSPLAKLFRCSSIRGAIYLLHTALELAAGATN